MKKRIFGLETEYALIFYPDRANAPRPSQKCIFELFSENLRESYVTAPARPRQGQLKPNGHFLANSILLHYEAHGDDDYQGLIEGCTPECISARETVIYQRALDEILRELVGKTEDALRAKGFSGKLVIGKNARDTHGNTYGCHENYLVDEPVHPLLWVLYPLALLVGLVLTTPIAISLGVLVACLSLLVLGCYAGDFALSRISSVPVIGVLTWPFWMAFRVGRNIFEGIPDQHWTRLLCALFQYAVLTPVARILSGILALAAFPRIKKHLTSFVVTRQILVGAGAVVLDGDEPGLHLSQRAGIIGRVASVFLSYQDQRCKPIYDIKNFIYDLGGPLRRYKRLHILFSDSNMSEVSQFLKVGMTGLVLKMIEAGMDFSELALRDPVGAIRDVSRVGFPALLELRDGRRVSAVQVQRAFLAAAKWFIAEDEDADGEDREIVGLWEDALERLETRPASLNGRLDWAIKKRLMDDIILERTTWVKFSSWGRIIERLRRIVPEDVDVGACSFRAIADTVGHRRFAPIQKMVDRAGLDPDEFQFYCDLYYEILKIDLRYHEISREGGYYDWLERARAVQTIAGREAVNLARRNPPPRTRANIRGHYVARAAQAQHELLVSWHKIRDVGEHRTIYLDDPFDYVLGDD